MSFTKINPFDVNDLLKAHGTMTFDGTDRRCRLNSAIGESVFFSERLVHMAPPADRVPFLIDDLFEWLKQAKDHLLIRSCVCSIMNLNLFIHSVMVMGVWAVFGNH